MAYRSWYQINKNFSNEMTYLLGAVHDYTGLVEAPRIKGCLSRLTDHNKEEIRKKSTGPTARLYEEEVCDMINERKLKSVKIVKKETGSMTEYYQLDKVVSLMYDMTMLANNMLNVEEEE